MFAWIGQEEGLLEMKHFYALIMEILSPKKRIYNKKKF